MKCTYFFLIFSFKRMGQYSSKDSLDSDASTVIERPITHNHVVAGNRGDYSLYYQEREDENDGEYVPVL